MLSRMLYLASQSPRRRELLARLGHEFGLLELDVPEQRQPGEPAEDYVRRVAREKAGAYAIQGAAEAFVTRLSGSYSGVMGLPLYETAQLLRQFGLG